MENLRISKSTVMSVFGTTLGLATISALVAEGKSYLEKIANLSPNEQLSGLLDVGNRLGQIVAPDQSRTNLDILTLADNARHLEQTVGHLDSSWASSLVNHGEHLTHHTNLSLESINHWEVVLPIGALIILGAFLSAGGTRN